MGVFRLIGNLELQVQKPHAEPANVPSQQLLGTQTQHQQSSSVRCTRLVSLLQLISTTDNLRNYVKAVFDYLFELI